MLNLFWNWWVIIISVGSILACWWLLHWTKGVSDRSTTKMANLPVMCGMRISGS